MCAGSSKIHQTQSKGLKFSSAPLPTVYYMQATSKDKDNENKENPNQSNNSAMILNNNFAPSLSFHHNVGIQHAMLSYFSYSESM